MKISIIMPTRGRIRPLIATIKSLLDNFSNDNDIEILLRFDDDDVNTLLAIEEQFDDRRIKYHVGPRYGWPGMHRYVNELVSRTRSDWLMFMNDDAIIQTKSWDKEIEKYNDRMVFLDCHVNHGHGLTFAIIPRKIYEIWGHISPSRHCDNWMFYIGNELNIKVMTAITILHDRADLTGNNRDTTFNEREYAKDYLSEENKKLMVHDITLLRKYIEKENANKS